MGMSLEGGNIHPKRLEVEANLLAKLAEDIEAAIIQV